MSFNNAEKNDREENKKEDSVFKKICILSIIGIALISVIAVLLCKACSNDPNPDLDYEMKASKLTFALREIASFEYNDTVHPSENNIITEHIYSLEYHDNKLQYVASMTNSGVVGITLERSFEDVNDCVSTVSENYANLMIYTVTCDLFTKYDADRELMNKFEAYMSSVRSDVKKETLSYVTYTSSNANEVYFSCYNLSNDTKTVYSNNLVVYSISEDKFSSNSVGYSLTFEENNVLYSAFAAKFKI